MIDRAGIGCEPASAATLAGAAPAGRRRACIAPEAIVAGILTGHMLKDPDTTIRAAGADNQAAAPIAPDARAVARALAPHLAR